MTETEIINAIAESLDVDVSEIHPDKEMSDYESWDSVAVLSIIAVINDRYCKFPKAEEVLTCRTIKDLIDFMK